MTKTERLRMELRASQYTTSGVIFLLLAFLLGEDEVSQAYLGEWTPVVGAIVGGIAVYKFVRAGILHWKLGTDYKREADATRDELKARKESDRLTA